MSSLADTLARTLGPASASADAQNVGAGLGIQNIRRGVGFAVLRGQGANIGVPVGAPGVFSPLVPGLSLVMVCSGRPLLVKVEGTISAGPSGTLRVSAALNGRELSGSVNGMPGLYNANAAAAEGQSGFWVDLSPPAGSIRLEVVANAGVSAGGVYVDQNNTLCLLAVEL